jgi:uncharacterized protein (UPF0333 family)
MTKAQMSWSKRILITVVLLAVATAAVYWYVATEKFSDTIHEKAAYTVNAIDFIREFEKDDKAANQKYSEQIITVNGRVAAVERADTTMNIKFIDSTTSSYIIFAFQEQHLEKVKTVQPGDSVSIKGSCSGGIHSEILGNEAISFKRCALNK